MARLGNAFALLALRSLYVDCRIAMCGETPWNGNHGGEALFPPERALPSLGAQLWTPEHEILPFAYACNWPENPAKDRIDEGGRRMQSPRGRTCVIFDIWCQKVSCTLYIVSKSILHTFGPGGHQLRT